MGILQDEVEGDVGSVPRCGTCGSENVVKDAWACWNPDTGLWELENVLDHEHCHLCEGKTKLDWVRQDPPPHKRIRELNDAFRMRGEGTGSLMITIGLQTFGAEFIQRAVASVRAFAQFSQNNDPWGEHDFGAFDLDDQKIFWKIDPYNLDCTAGSENPANAAVTHRVLTIMLASEY